MCHALATAARMESLLIVLKKPLSNFHLVCHKLLIIVKVVQGVMAAFSAVGNHLTSPSSSFQLTLLTSF